MDKYTRIVDYCDGFYIQLEREVRADKLEGTHSVRIETCSDIGP